MKFTQENTTGQEVSVANQRVWLYGEDGTTLVKSVITNTNGWADFGAQPERFAIAYQVGKQWIYRTISQNPGEIKVVSPFNETLNGNCPVSKTVEINAITGSDFSARSNHPEWVITRNNNKFTICAARAPLDGTFDLWTESSAGYQKFAAINWEGESTVTFSPQAPTLSNWSFTPASKPVTVFNVLIKNASQLAVFEQFVPVGDLASTLNKPLNVPKSTGTGYNLVLQALDEEANDYKITRAVDSLTNLPAITLPEASIKTVTWNYADLTATWEANPASDFDFFELNIELRKGLNLVALLDKSQSSFTMPQLPTELESSLGIATTVELASVDFADFSDLDSWLNATQNPAITLDELVLKARSAEDSVTRITHK
jgi:hypothetical protein